MNEEEEVDLLARELFKLQFHSTHWWDAGSAEKDDYRHRARQVIAAGFGYIERSTQK